MQLNNLSQRAKFLYNMNHLSYSKRASFAHHELAKKLFLLMDEKETNLGLVADVPTKKEFLELIDRVGPHVAVVKTHIDIITDFDWDLIEQLQLLQEKHKFIIIEDRKFSDIGAIVQRQYRDGIYHISDWADTVIAHSISGPGVIEGLKEVGLPKNRGMFLVTQLSCAGNLISESYTTCSIKMAQKHKDFVIGFISQERCCLDPGFLQLTPGVNLQKKGDNLGQQYRTPDYLIKEKSTDIILVGRGIYSDKNPEEKAAEYKRTGWKAYLERQK